MSWDRYQLFPGGDIPRGHQETANDALPPSAEKNLYSKGYFQEMHEKNGSLEPQQVPGQWAGEGGRPQLYVFCAGDTVQKADSDGAYSLSGLSPEKGASRIGVTGSPSFPWRCGEDVTEAGLVMSWHFILQ